MTGLRCWRDLERTHLWRQVRWVGVVAMLLAATPAFAQQPAAGRVKVASGAAFIVRAGNLLPVQVGQEVYEADGLKTGPTAASGSC